MTMPETSLQAALLQHLSGFLTTGRWQRFQEVASARTRHITVVLEDIYQPHNASAVLRSCDCFGIQDVHIIENRNAYTVNPDVALGSSRWLSLHRYNRQDDNTMQCIQALRDKGYRIIATTPHARDTEIGLIDLGSPIALLFGTELNGLSDTAIQAADGYARIPMAGFTESFNISVSVAICLYELSGRLRRTCEPSLWQLSGNERQALLLEWVRQSLKRADLLEKEFLDRHG